MDKLTATVTFHCTDDTKRLIAGLASVDGSDSSNWLRELRDRGYDISTIKEKNANGSYHARYVLAKSAASE